MPPFSPGWCHQPGPKVIFGQPKGREAETFGPGWWHDPGPKVGIGPGSYHQPGPKVSFQQPKRAGSRDLWSRFVPPTGTNAYLWSRLVARTGTKGGYWSRLVPPTGTNGLRLAQRMFSPTSLAEGRQYWFISAGVPPLSSSSLKQALGPKPFSASGPTGLSMGLHPGPKIGWVSSRMQAMVAQ